MIRLEFVLKPESQKRTGAFGRVLAGKVLKKERALKA